MIDRHTSTRRFDDFLHLRDPILLSPFCSEDVGLSKFRQLFEPGCGFTRIRTEGPGYYYVIKLSYKGRRASRHPAAPSLPPALIFPALPTRIYPPALECICSNRVTSCSIALLVSSPAFYPLEPAHLSPRYLNPPADVGGGMGPPCQRTGLSPPNRLKCEIPPSRSVEDPSHRA